MLLERLEQRVIVVQRGSRALPPHTQSGLGVQRGGVWSPRSMRVRRASQPRALPVRAGETVGGTAGSGGNHSRADQ